MTDTDGPVRTSRTPTPGLGPVLLAVVLLASAPVAMSTTGATQSAAELPHEPALLIALDSNGSARVTLVVPFDLSTDAERAAFGTLRTNATARERRTDRFARRLEDIARRTAATTGREMAIADPSARFVERGDTGIVALSATWVGLAARSGDALVLREPFASGFDPDRTVHVVAPEGFELAAATPTPTARTVSSARWSAGASLAGFEARFVPAGDANGGLTADAPGFGVAVAVLAVLVLVGLLAVLERRR